MRAVVSAAVYTSGVRARAPAAHLREHVSNRRVASDRQYRKYEVTPQYGKAWQPPGSLPHVRATWQRELGLQVERALRHAEVDAMGPARQRRALRIGLPVASMRARAECSHDCGNRRAQAELPGCQGRGWDVVTRLVEGSDGDRGRSGCYIGGPRQRMPAMRARGLRSCRIGVRKRIADTAALVEIGYRGERQGAAARTGITILVLEEGFRCPTICTSASTDTATSPVPCERAQYV